MFRIISDKKAQEIILKNDSYIKEISNKYNVPTAIIKAVLFMELSQIDIFDILADLIVKLRLPIKKDSSTGVGQIFGKVGLEAILFALDAKIIDKDYLGIDHKLDINNPNDIRLIWNKLQDTKTNIEVSTLNILHCAKQMTNRIDFNSYNEDELKLILTRYNQNTNKITPYSTKAYSYYLEYLEK